MNVRIWYLLGTPTELRTEETTPDRTPAVGDIVGGRPVVRVWPGGDASHVWRILFEAGVLGAANLEELAREAGLWEPTERVRGLVAELGLNLNHVAGESALHRMVFVVRHEQHETAQRGEGAFPLQAVVDFAQRNGFAPQAQAVGTVVPMPMLVRDAEGKLTGPGVAVSERLRAFLLDERNAMPPRDWAQCLLIFAADFALMAGMSEGTFAARAAESYAAKRAGQ